MTQHRSTSSAAPLLVASPHDEGRGWHAGRLELLALVHVAVLLVVTAWDFGGETDFARLVICWWGTLALPIAGLVCLRRFERRDAMPAALRWLWPLLVFDGLVLWSTLNPTFSYAILGGARVLVSTSSRTSVQLLELLARDRWGVAFDVESAPAERADLERLRGIEHDAALVIGDGALLLSAAHAYPHVVDLGAAWKDWTGLPFVFAVWAARRAVDRQAVRDVHRALLASRKWGLAHLDDLAASAAAATGVARATCREYLEGLDYGLSYRHLAGLADFLRRLAARGVVPDGTLSFLGAA